MKTKQKKVLTKGAIGKVDNLCGPATSTDKILLEKFLTEIY